MSSAERHNRGRLVPFPQVLILLGLYLFGSGGDSDQRRLSEIVGATVEDEVRSARAQEIARRIEARVLEGDQLILSSIQSLVDAVRSYEPRQEQIDALYELQDLKWKQVNHSLLELRFALKRQLTRDEWGLIIGEYVAR